MENIRQIISENLIFLRHKAKLTQLQLAEKINYSDKAVSRWETGESLPSYEILEELAKIYQVDYAYFFISHNFEEEMMKKQEKEGNKIVVLIFSITALWTLLIAIFVYLAVFKDVYYWQLFVYGVPMSTVGLIIQNYITYHKKRIFIICYSIFMWTFITSIYVCFIESNFWMIFLVGIPLQVCIVALAFIRYPIHARK